MKTDVNNICKKSLEENIEKIFNDLEVFIEGEGVIKKDKDSVFIKFSIMLCYTLDTLGYQTTVL